jgi:hypothetical protein
MELNPFNQSELDGWSMVMAADYLFQRSVEEQAILTKLIRDLAERKRMKETIRGSELND